MKITYLIINLIQRHCGYRFEKTEIYFSNIPLCKVEVGEASYSSRIYPIRIDAESNQTLRIGKYTSIGASLDLIMGGGHDTKQLSNYGFAFYAKRCEKGDVEIGNDVWIGNDVTIVGGKIKIGDGAVVGARSVITNEMKLRPYGVYAGCPARLLRYRFSRKTIAKLLASKWWDMQKESIEKFLTR